MLEKLKNEGLFEDTTIIYMSDHGFHMHGIFYDTNSE